MSTARAITQLIKSRVTIAKKISALQEQKAAMQAAVEEKYAEKQNDLNTQLLEVRNALLSLNFDDEKIRTASADYCSENGLEELSIDNKL